MSENPTVMLMKKDVWCWTIATQIPNGGLFESLFQFLFLQVDIRYKANCLSEANKCYYCPIASLGIGAL